MNQPNNDITRESRIYIEELQNYLRTIALNDPRIPLIGVDGIFGSETTEAVAAFQSRNGVPVTGRVDRVTWEAVYNEYLRVLALQTPALAIRVFPETPPFLREGDTGDAVVALQLLLAHFADRFENVPAADVNGTFDQNTKNAVLAVQPLAGMEATGVVDKNTWNRLARLYNDRDL